jgi:hypothetical protein
LVYVITLLIKWFRLYQNDIGSCQAMDRQVIEDIEGEQVTGCRQRAGYSLKQAAGNHEQEGSRTDDRQQRRARTGPGVTLGRGAGSRSHYTYSSLKKFPPKNH